ncbi:hypothetical protein cce_0814 [Crocosphaera subtropica ATCC 51142]|uniref:Uncharacterized protein n=1 Tax=Crocosphaera subtropica (strain ATCC 51142 / BH68) TaxID=43989 RepID=B1WRX1_CROS5|nr:hypothetical protein cce_0814 [Crocosphaera subtropica ATCC 51142]
MINIFKTHKIFPSEKSKYKLKFIYKQTCLIFLQKPTKINNLVSYSIDKS